MTLIINQQQRNRTIKAYEGDIALIKKWANDFSCSTADIIHALCEQLRRDIYFQEFAEACDNFHSSQRTNSKLESL